MKVGILKCDSVSDRFVKEHGHYPEMFATLLHSADPSLEFVEFNVEHEELPQDIHAVDAYLITGSRHGVNDGYPWITQLEEFVRALNDANKKIIGICFGHQLIAKALGGKVIKSPKGWGVGVSQTEICESAAWMEPPKERLNLLVSHQDQVIELPPGAKVLATNDFCPNYLLQMGSNIMTVQGHPEFTKAYSRALMESREDILNEVEFKNGIKSLELPVDEALIARWMINFLKTH